MKGQLVSIIYGYLSERFSKVLKSFWRHMFVVALTSNDLNLVYCREVRWCSTTEVWALIIAKGILRHQQNYSCHILNKRPQTRRPTLNARTSIQSSVNNKYDIDDETFLIFYNRDVVLRILVFVYNEERIIRAENMANIQFYKVLIVKNFSCLHLAAAITFLLCQMRL